MVKKRQVNTLALGDSVALKTSSRPYGTFSKAQSQ